MADKKQLLDLATQAYNMDEIRDLCFRLDIDFDDIPGETKKAKLREIITYLKRNGRLADLETDLRQERPHLLPVLEQQESLEALNYYYDHMQMAWDRIDLMGQQERDTKQILTRFTLRDFYVPLRVEVAVGEPSEQSSDPENLRGADVHRREVNEITRTSIGELLQKSPRLVILGDPGSGKTTLTKWLALSYLLKQQSQNDMLDFPEMATLPEKPWLPIIIPCRYMDSGNFFTIDQLLRRSLSIDLQRPDLVEPLCNLILKKMDAGEVLLIIDGLDEISPPNARASFSKALGKIVKSYQNVPVVVTSRQYGYEQMGFRLKDGFEEVAMSPLRPSEQKTFIHQWCQITQADGQESFMAKRMLDTIEADAIKKIARNPLQLTTIALVLQKQPNISPRRIHLYTACIDILFNWHPERKEHIDQRIAERHLGYLAYYMCAKEIKTLDEDEIIALWEEMQEQRKRAYPSPEELLEGLTARTNILVTKQRMSRNGRVQPVYAFQHALFQDFLAGQQGIMNGLYPGFQERLHLPEHIDKLADEVDTITRKIHNSRTEIESVIAEKWQEPVRLCIAGYDHIDVDDVLLSLLADKGDSEIGRARAVLAASCLLDEPDVDISTTRTVLENLMKYVQDFDAWNTSPDARKTSMDDVVWELGQRKAWADLLKEIVVAAFINQPANTVNRFVYGRVFLLGCNSQKIVDSLDEASFDDLVKQLTTGNQTEIVSSALILMDAAFNNRLAFNPLLLNTLIDVMVKGTPPVQTAASWAFRWLVTSYHNRKIQWQPDAEQAKQIYAFLSNPTTDKCAIINLFIVITDKLLEMPKLHRWTLIAGQKYELPDQEAKKSALPNGLKNALIYRLTDEVPRIRRQAALTLGQIGFLDERILGPLLELIDGAGSQKEKVDRETAIQLLGCLPGEKVIATLEERLNSSDEEIQNSAKRALIGRQSAVSDNEFPNWHLSHNYQFDSCLACVLVKGAMPKTGQKGYVYVSLHLHELVKMLLDIEKDNYMNSSNYHATVLARFSGEPSEDVMKFMRRKFGYSDSEIIIQREDETAVIRSVPAPEFPILAKAEKKSSVVDEKENDFPLKDIVYMRIGSGYIHQTPNYDLNLVLFKTFCDLFNELYADSSGNDIIFEQIKG